MRASDETGVRDENGRERGGAGKDEQAALR